MLGRIMKAVNKAAEPDAPEATGPRFVGWDADIVRALMAVTGADSVWSRPSGAKEGVWSGGYRHDGQRYIFFDGRKIKHVVRARDVAARLADTTELTGGEVAA